MVENTSIESDQNFDLDSSRERAAESHVRVLVVDDDPGILQSLVQLLQLTYPNYHIVSAASAEDAMIAVEMSPIELVITDLRLPTIDGLELARQIRRRAPSTKFILMTAYGDCEIMMLSHERGCQAYLEKPFSVEQLLQYIEEALHPEEALQAHLAGLAVSDILELYLSHNERVVLGVASNGFSGIVVVDDGRVKHAQYNRTTGWDALKQILACKSGIVSTLKTNPPQQHSLDVDLGELRKAVDDIAACAHLSSTQRSFLLPEIKKTRAIAAQLKVAAPSVVGVATEAPASEASEEELQLHATPGDALAIKQAEVRKLVADGNEHFHAKNLHEAGRCWMRALRLDPDCIAAKKNLQLLEQAADENPQAAGNDDSMH